MSFGANSSAYKTKPCFFIALLTPAVCGLPYPSIFCLCRNLLRVRSVMVQLPEVSQLEPTVDTNHRFR